MNKTIIKAPCVELKDLESIFIEMTAQNCNLRCKHCYIKFKDKKIKDFIPIEKVKQNLSLITKEKIKFIHLTGAEPMLHPDFNQILRLCLKHASVVIHTNAHCINDKKARFLRKVEEENNLGNEIIFMLSLDHYIEKENDLLRGRGSYRKTIHAIQSLTKYEFNPILCIVNHNNMDKNELLGNFKELCNSINFETSDINFKIIPLLERREDSEIINLQSTDNLKIECTNSRTLTINGIFSCPLLSTDNRGKCGSTLEDYSKKNYLETTYCKQCTEYNNYLFSLTI